MLAYHAQGLDPAFNLALEETLFQSLTPGHPGHFLLWRNGPSIIVGRHQNTVEEINEEFVRARHLPVVRRPTGGGAVYHDEGNLNFSFLVWLDRRSRTDFAFFLEPIVAALRELGLQAELSSRNDITVNGSKVSGSAQRRSGERMLHHGTLLVDVDRNVLGQALTGNPDKYQSKGVASHRSRVANLRELLPPGLDRGACLRLVTDALLRRCASTPWTPDPFLLQQAGELADSRYRSWDWNYGKSPAFTARRRRRFPWGALECRVNVRQGVITDCRMFGDFFSLNDVGELEQALTGTRFTPADIRARLSALPPDKAVETRFVGGEQAPLLDFLCSLAAPAFDGEREL